MNEAQNSAGESTPQNQGKQNINGSRILSDLKFYNGYSRYNPFLERKETWEESVMRVMDMHKYNPKFKEAFKNEEFRELFNYATEAYKEKLVLASQRTLQFGGESIMKHNARLYNCLTSYCDRTEFFQECLYWLLCGCGVGFSVQTKHINKLPSVAKRTKGAKTFTVPDSMEGWADAIGVLMSSYFTTDPTFPEYQGCEIKFDYSQIRPEGALISGGFKAPGPEGLRKSLIKIEELLERSLIENGDRLKPIVAYDIIMHLSDAVLSGGVRRSATICLFSPEDKEMLNAKTGNWFYNNPQRARSNNSVLLIKDKTTREQFAEIMNSVKSFGEPGFIFSDSEDIIFNPCLIGSTLIKTKGGEVSIKELAEKTLENQRKTKILSYNEDTKELEWKKLKFAIKTKSMAKTITLKFNDNTEVTCTPDHQIFTLNRGYIAAKHLEVDDEIISSSTDLTQYRKDIKTQSELEYSNSEKWTNVIFDPNQAPWNTQLNVELEEDKILQFQEYYNYCVSNSSLWTRRKVFKEQLDNFNMQEVFTDIVNLYKEGYGTTVIARKLGINRLKLLTVFKALDVQLRDSNIVTEKLKEFRSERVKGNKNPWSYKVNTEHKSICGYYNNWLGERVYLRSTYEYIFAKWLDKQKVNWTTEPFVLKHVKDGKESNYRPDFVVYNENGEIEKIYEIKGPFYTENEQKALNLGVTVVKNIEDYTELSYEQELELWKLSCLQKVKRLVSIEESEKEDVYDLTVEDNHNFFANGTLVHNCVEIGMVPKTEDGRSGWQGCNLTEINGSQCTSKEAFLRACKASAIIGTLQAAYTDFKYVNPVAKEIFDREALLGCSITGFANNPKILFDPEILKEGAELIKVVNKQVADLIGIRQAARTTCVKPSGNASVLLETASGIHGEHSEMYFRIMQMNKNDEVAKHIAAEFPELIEESVWSATKSDYAVYIPIKTKKGSLYKEQLLGVKQLEYVKLVQQTWVEVGTNVDLCVDPKTRHNVSNTITVDNWDEVEEYIYENRKFFAGISLLPYSGDKIYSQAPFTAVLKPEQILEKYGQACLFASGLIVDALHCFEDNLWTACDHVLRRDLPLDGTRTQVLLKKDWVRRAKQFAKRYFKNNLEEMTFCLKDIHLYHKWLEVSRAIKGLDISKVDLKPEFTAIDTLGAVACSGTGCEVTSI